jgi:hypothetical protein
VLTGRQVARLVLEETGLLPHTNPGVLDREELALLRAVGAKPRQDDGEPGPEQTPAARARCGCGC